MSIDDDDPYLRPFEWLTSPQSLQPYIIEALQSTNNNINYDDRNNSSSCSSIYPCHNNNKSVLHVGCGSSILGEQLLLDTDYNVHYVLNIDNDINAIERMKLRWDNMMRSNDKQHQKISSSSSSCLNDDDNTNSNNMNDKILDFQIVEFKDNTTRIDVNDNSFDMILDKGTLDCLLCLGIDVIASLLNETYRLLKPDIGIYFIISFQSLDLLLPLLQNIPNINWDVTYTIIKRDTECLNNHNHDTYNDINKVDSTTTTTKITNTTFHNNTTTSKNNDHHLNYLNNNEDDKFTTVKIIQCRKRQQPKTTSITTTTCTSTLSTINSSRSDIDGNPSTSLDDNDNNINWNILCHHISDAYNQYFQKSNPFLTKHRIEEIHQSFLHHSIESITSSSSSTTTGRKLTLYESYIILFNEAEREHYLYDDDFLLDWYEFCKNKKQNEQTLIDVSSLEEELLLFDETSMTVEIAMEFLKETQ